MSVTATAIAAADSIVADWVDAGRVPGAVLLIAQDGEVIHERAYGASRLIDYGSGQYPRPGIGYGESTAEAAEGADIGPTRLPRPIPMTTESPNPMIV